MREHQSAARSTIDRTESDLATLVADLRSEGAITDDDAAEFRHRIATLAADLDGCTADRRQGER